MTYGFYIPFQVSTGSVGYLASTESEIEALKQDMRCLFVTNWGERPMKYYFGCNMREFLFEQRNEQLKQKIADRIIDQFGRWLPFVQFTTLNIIFSEEQPDIPQNGVSVSGEVRLSSRPGSAPISFREVIGGIRS